MKCITWLNISEQHNKRAMHTHVQPTPSPPDAAIEEGKGQGSTLNPENIDITTQISL